MEQKTPMCPISVFEFLFFVVQDLVIVASQEKTRFLQKNSGFRVFICFVLVLFKL